MIIQKGITNIKYPRFPNAKCQDDADLVAAQLMLDHHPEVIVTELDCLDSIFRTIEQTKYYMDCKINDI